MKKLLLFLWLLVFCSAKAQYPSYNINLAGILHPNTIDAEQYGRHYSGCWGWYQPGKNKEYAISGASNGTYFIDISAPATPTVCDYVDGGRHGCTWREVKTYGHYCYIVSDDAKPNAFQIVDMQYLPDSVHLVYSGRDIFERAHTLYVEDDKLFVCGVTYSTGIFPSTSPMLVFSLANPEAPALLRKFEDDVPFNIVEYVHDAFIRHDTVYASCAYKGLQIYKFRNIAGTYSFVPLGSYADYPTAGYNHSSWLTQNGKYLVFCDEVPAAMPIHVVDVQNLSNIQPIIDVSPFPRTTPHNPHILGNNFAVVASYQDGLLIYNISNPASPELVGYFDTYPQGGNNFGSYGSRAYMGNWGAYPYLPSGLIIAQDTDNGIFILDPAPALNTPVGLNTTTGDETELKMYPNPASNSISLYYHGTDAALLQLKDLLGRVVYEKNYDQGINDYLDVSRFENGSYVLSVINNRKTQNKQVIIHH